MATLGPLQPTPADYGDQVPKRTPPIAAVLVAAARSPAGRFVRAVLGGITAATFAYVLFLLGERSMESAARLLGIDNGSTADLKESMSSAKTLMTLTSFYLVLLRDLTLECVGFLEELLPRVGRVLRAARRLLRW